jgi:hypothetical protein
MMKVETGWVGSVDRNACVVAVKEEKANFVKSSSDEAVTGAPSGEGRSGHVQGMSGVRKVRKSSGDSRY